MSFSFHVGIGQDIFIDGKRERILKARFAVEGG